MCIRILSNRIEGPVVAWKIFHYRNRKLRGLRDFKYKVETMYTTSDPGFQAFVHKKHAEYTLRKGLGSWLRDSVVRKVFLYDAAQGIIENMCSYSNGMPGWTARKIRVPRKTKD